MERGVGFGSLPVRILFVGTTGSQAERDRRCSFGVVGRLYQCLRFEVQIADMACSIAASFFVAREVPLVVFSHSRIA